MDKTDIKQNSMEKHDKVMSEALTEMMQATVGNPKLIVKASGKSTSEGITISIYGEESFDQAVDVKNRIHFILNGMIQAMSGDAKSKFTLDKFEYKPAPPKGDSHE